MDTKSLLIKQAEQAKAVAKALADGDIDGAVDLMKAQADEITAELEKLEKEEETPAKEVDEEKEEEIEKVSITKSQADALAIVESVGIEKLKKWADLHISGVDLGDIMDQLKDAQERLETIEKASKQMPESVDKKNKSSLSGVLSVG